MQDLYIFDFFGVIADEVADKWLNKHIGEEAAKTFRAEVITKADLGLISEDQLFNKVAKAAGISRKEALQGWLDTVKIKHETVKLIKQLRREGHFVALLSNAPDNFLHRILKRDNLYDLFDKIIISCEVKVVKPDPEIFNKMLAFYDGTYEQAFFIDDNIDNVNASEFLGIKGIHFVSAAQLRRDLGK